MEDLKNKILTENEKHLRWVEIYKITNLINNKMYIGQSISHCHKGNGRYYPKGMHMRFKEHIRESNFKYKYHCNALNNAFKTYGVDNFKVELIQTCSIEEANAIESGEIIKHNTLVPNGYNITLNCKNVLPSMVIREKISIGNQKNHLDRHLAKYKDVNFQDDKSNYDKYITPRHCNNVQIGWYLRINKIATEFKSSTYDMQSVKNRIYEFLDILKSLNGNTTKLRENLKDDTI